jgi:dTDP-glucose 4,6-dehydratase
MKILIYGGKGWIGQQFVNILQTRFLQHQYILGKARVDNTLSLTNEIKEINPTHIVSFIGRTHGKIGEKLYSTIDYLEQPGKLQENIRDNLFSPISLGLICKERNIHLTYLGTGCIFNFDENHSFGKEEQGFLEASLPNFFGSEYSTVKGFTDRLIPIMDAPILNLRIRMPIAGEDNPRNFITKITTYEKICSTPNSMTVLPELLPLIVDMMNNKTIGTINLTNPGLISHNEILQIYKELVDPKFVWKNFSPEEQSKILTSERSNNFLDTTKLESLYKVKNIKDSIRELLTNYKRNVSENSVQSTDFVNSSDTILLVTGGSGFIGSNFINLIMNKFDKIKVINFDAMYYCANEENVEKCWRDCIRYTFIKGNLCSIDLVQHIFNKYQPTHIIHFAAQSHVQTSFTDALRYTQDNIVGTHTLLECCRVYGKIQKFIHVSTDEVYGESITDVNEKHKTECSVLCPTNPYAATKSGAELLAQSYIHSFGMPIIITRGNNVYGPNQYPEKVIPHFIQQLKQNNPVTIQGNGSCVRAFLHVNDTVTAFFHILEKGKLGDIYNIGCDEGMEFSILSVAKILIKHIHNTDNYRKWITYINDRPFNDKRYYISNQKLKDLGWRITIDFESGIKSLLSNSK